MVYTYVWSDDAGVVQQTTSQTAATSDVFLGSGTTEGHLGCEVTPYDSTDFGSSVSATVTVEDSRCSTLHYNTSSSEITRFRSGFGIGQQDFTLKCG